MKRQLAGLVVGTSLLCGCPQAAKDVTDAGKLVACVLAHENEPPAQIVTDCQKEGLQVAVDTVDTILEAHRQAVARERAAGTLPACDAGAGK